MCSIHFCSIKENKLLPYQDFLLYKAETKRQPSIKFTRTEKSNESTIDGETMPQEAFDEYEAVNMPTASEIKEFQSEKDHNDSKGKEENQNESNQETLKCPPQRSPAKVYSLIILYVS